MEHRKLTRIEVFVIVAAIFACNLIGVRFGPRHLIGANKVEINAVESQSAVAWKRLDVRGRVTLKIPADMESIEPFGDDIRHREAFRNKDFSITIVSDLLLPRLIDDSQKQLLFSCETPRSVKENLLYRESLIEIDGRKAKLGITKASSERALSAVLCFAASDESSFPLHLVAICKNDRALETAMEVFRSVIFKKKTS